jgi:hypothetical protein
MYIYIYITYIKRICISEIYSCHYATLVYRSHELLRRFMNLSYVDGHEQVASNFNMSLCISRVLTIF